MSRPRVMLVLPTRTYRARAFLNALQRLRIDAVVASEEPSSLAPFMDGRMLTVDLRDGESAAAAAEAFAEAHPVEAVVGVDESAVLTAAHIAERLGLRHHPAAAVARTRDKRLLRDALAVAGVAQPDHLVLRSDDAPAEVSQRIRSAFGYPAVLKPVDLAASRGVIRVDDEAQLEVALQRITGMLAGDPACGEGPWPLLAERFIPGPEVALEGIVDRGTLHVLAIFDKPDPLDGPYFEETIYVTPSRLVAGVQDAVWSLTRRAVCALGLSDGPVHAELRLSESGPVFLEVAARSIGGRCSAALEFTDSRALEDLIVLQALGRLEPEMLQPSHGASGVLMLPIAEAGRLLAVEGLEAARQVPHVRDVEIAIPLGEEVRPLPEGDRYLGFAFARADRPGAVEEALRQVRAALQVRVAAVTASTSRRPS